MMTLTRHIPWSGSLVTWLHQPARGVRTSQRRRDWRVCAAKKWKGPCTHANHPLVHVHRLSRAGNREPSMCFTGPGGYERHAAWIRARCLRPVLKTKIDPFSDAR